MNNIEKMIKEEKFHHEPDLRVLKGDTITATYHNIPRTEDEAIYTVLSLEDKRPLSREKRKLLIDNNGLTYVTDAIEV